MDFEATLSFFFRFDFLIVLSLIISLCFLKNFQNRLFKLILILLLTTEFLSVFFLILDIQLSLLYSVSFIIHNCLWIFIILKNIKNKKTANFLFSAYLLFSLINLFFIEGLKNLNYNIFIIGSITYLLLFIVINVLNLKNENLDFFKSNNYLMLCCPILFFFGFGLMFSFRENKLLSIIIINKINLYQTISYFVNTVYYTLILIFSYRERKLQNG